MFELETRLYLTKITSLLSSLCLLVGSGYLWYLGYQDMTVEIKTAYVTASLLGFAIIRSVQFIFNDIENLRNNHE